MNKVKDKKELQSKVSEETTDTFKLEMDNGEKELAWLPKSLCSKLKRSQDKGEQEKMILDFISQSERDLEYSIESLEDDVIRFKGAMLKARKEFEIAKDEQLNSNYELWEKFDKELPKVEQKVKTIVAKLEPIRNEIDSINTLLSKVESYKIDNFVETLEKAERILRDQNLMTILEKLNNNR